jgi:putative endonuclease
MGNTSLNKMSREHRKMLGDLGEDVASIYLKRHGYEIVERNYWKKWGEIDIVARKDRIWRFVEVKAVTREIPDSPRHNVIRETLSDEFRAEDNIHPRKIQRLSRAIQSYLMEKGLDEVNWQIDAVTVELDLPKKRSRVSIIENVL